MRELLARFGGLLQCVIYVHEGCNPGFDLPNDLMARVGALGLSLDFDIYCLAEDDGPAADPPAG